MLQTEKKDGSKSNEIAREILGYVIAVVSAVVVAVLIRVFILEPFIVPTPSMEPTLMVDDKVIINKMAYKVGPINRGDIVAFHSTTEEGKDLVKRAIAVEGDRIMLTSDGEIYVNDEKIAEDYLPDDGSMSYLNQEEIIGEGQVFVMGDNRDNSYDSRYFGTIPEEDIFGEFLIIYWPPSRW